MDSGGSMQSSNGGADDDQEFHSTGGGGGSDSISSFLNHNTYGTATPNPSQFLRVHNQNPTFLFNQNQDQSNPFPQQPNPYINTTNDHFIWSSSGLRSEPNYTHFTNIAPPSSSTPRPFPGPSPSVQQQQQQRMEPEAHTSRPVPDQVSNVIKNPKKRTRASRRAPTTVLTTDTTNFRQMVQEFTGIPAVPFSGSPYSRRMDLFSAASGLGPLYPLRPEAHKFIPPFSSSQTLLNSAMLDSTNNSGAIGGASTSNNFADHLLNLEQHQNISLQSFGNLSGFASRGESRGVRNNNSNDGVQENLVQFDGNVNSGGDPSVQQQQMNMSGGVYNLNVSEKGMENVVVSSGPQGNVANSWICPSD